MAGYGMKKMAEGGMTGRPKTMAAAMKKVEKSAADRRLDKIGTNNRLRKSLRVAVAQFGLGNPDASVRRAAVTGSGASGVATNTALPVFRRAMASVGVGSDPAATGEYGTSVTRRAVSRRSGEVDKIRRMTLR